MLALTTLNVLIGHLLYFTGDDWSAQKSHDKNHFHIYLPGAR